jgi:hypothetical protein
VEEVEGRIRRSLNIEENPLGDSQEMNFIALRRVRKDRSRVPRGGTLSKCLEVIKARFEGRERGIFLVKHTRSKTASLFKMSVASVEVWGNY